MFTSRNEPTHLESLHKAKQRFKTVLAKRINDYEERLKKPLLTQTWEYLRTHYGKTGYERTKKFLERMWDTTRTEQLIDLTKEYHQGSKLSFILKIKVLEICSFNNQHILIVQNKLKQEILNKIHDKKHQPLALLNIEFRAIEHIYQKITTSNDYGNNYLTTLNNHLEKLCLSRSSPNLL